jgi:hypothetical protein
MLVDRNNFRTFSSQRALTFYRHLPRGGVRSPPLDARARGRFRDRNLKKNQSHSLRPTRARRLTERFWMT